MCPIAEVEFVYSAQREPPVASSGEVRNLSLSSIRRRAVAREAGARLFRSRTDAPYTERCAPRADAGSRARTGQRFVEAMARGEASFHHLQRGYNGCTGAQRRK